LQPAAVAAPVPPVSDTAIHNLEILLGALKHVKMVLAGCIAFRYHGIVGGFADSPANVSDIPPEVATACCHAQQSMAHGHLQTHPDNPQC